MVCDVLEAGALCARRLKLALLALGIWLGCSAAYAQSWFDAPPRQGFAESAFDGPWSLETELQRVAFVQLAQEDNPPLPPRERSEEDQPREPLGSAPPDTSLLFLRQAAVLLRPGQVQVDYGLRYIWEEVVSPIVYEVPGGQVVLHQRVRNRRLFVPTAIRFGLFENVQPFVNLPFGFTLGERADAVDSDYTSVFGLGDIQAGLAYHLYEQDTYNPDVIVNFSFVAPTGHHPFQLGSPQSVNGNGFWGVSAGMTWIKAYDPAVVFGSLNYTHEFSRSFIHFGEVIPGEIFDYSLGVGFALNDRLTLSTIFFGSLQTTAVVDGRGVPDSSLEPFWIRLALTGTMGYSRIIEPFVNFGLSEDAPQVDFGIVVTRQF